MYPLEWLDSLVLHTFNPRETNINEISKSDLLFISENVILEKKNIQTRIKNELFAIRKKSEIRLEVRKYHSMLVYLLDTFIANRESGKLMNLELCAITDLIIKSLEELMFFIENRYASYLSLDERVPITYLMLIRKEFDLKLDKLRKRNFTDERTSIVLSLIVAEITVFIKSLSGKKITYRQILYFKDLFKSLASFKTGGFKRVYYEIDILLIDRNFNSFTYMNSFIEFLKEDLDSYLSNNDKLERVLFFYKEFSYLNCNERISFDVTKFNFKYAVETWFKNEIIFLERKAKFIKDFTNELPDNPEPKSQILDNKVECDLSADQIALILRAADESRIIKARSMNLVFQTIVPHLSTSFKKDLSYQSVRSKSYSAEERDKDVAVAVLEKIIKKIKTY